MRDVELPPGRPPVPQAPARPVWALDVISLALLALFWLAYVTPIVVTERLHGGDVFRDAASAVNIAHGRLFDDPAYRGETIWYPLLSPAVVAGLSAIFDVRPLDCYRWSPLLFNWMIPAGLYLLVRLYWGWRAAAGATVALLLAMPWWQTEVVQGQPSVHAVVWGWAALLLYGQQHRRASLGWALACALFQGIAFWHHPMIPAVLTGAFVLQTFWTWWRALPESNRKPDAAGPVARSAVVIVISLLVAGPILYLMLHGPVLNSVPREFIAPELRTVEFALLHGNPWIWGMGLVGLSVSIRRADFGSRLLVCALLLCLAGQLFAYPRILGWSWAAGFPLIVPHEFQWTFQLGWAVCVGVGIDSTLRFLAGRWTSLRPGSFALSGATLLALVLTGVWGLPNARQNLRRFVHRYARNFPQTTAWVWENTEINDVFACHPTWAFAWLNAHTGRKVWLTEPGHSNPRVAWKQREYLLRQLMAAPSPEAFWHLARQLDIDYCIFSPEWRPLIIAHPDLRRRAVPTYLEVVYPGGEDEPAILRVRQAPLTAPPGS